MNYLRLFIGALSTSLMSSGTWAQHRTMVTLDEIFSIAEASSAQLRPAVTAITEADRAVSEARAGLLPDIGATLSLSYIGDGFTTARDLSDYQKAPIPHFGSGLSLNIEQPIYTGGALTGSIELARLKSTATRYAAELKRDNLRFQLTGFYLDIYKCDNLRRVVESNLDAAGKELAQMRARYEQGTALQNDITRYELLVANLELQLLKLDNTLRILNDNLVTIAGLPEGTVVEPDSTILERALPREAAQWWLQEAERESPSLGIARTGVDISRRVETISRAERLPKIGLQAGWTIDGPILVEVPPINRNLSYWYAGVGVSYNISSLFKTGKTLARNRAATILAAEELEAARERVAMDVRADHIRYLEAYEELKTQQKSLELAERNYRVTSTRYNADMALITDMLDAANARLDAGQQLVNARINIIYYYYKLLFTTGKI